MKLYNEIKNEVRNVMEAESNSLAWKQEARNRMKDVNALITAAEKVNKDDEGKSIKIDRVELVKKIRAEIEAENAAATEEPTDPDAYMTREVENGEETAETPEAPEAE